MRNNKIDKHEFVVWISCFCIIIPKCLQPEFAYMKRVSHICEFCKGFFTREYILQWSMGGGCGSFLTKGNLSSGMILDKGGHFPADQNGQPPCCPHLHDHNHRRRHHGDDDVDREIIIIVTIIMVTMMSIVIRKMITGSVGVIAYQI